MLEINPNKNIRLLKEKSRQGLIVGILFIVCSFILSFFSIEILYKVISKVNIENMINQDALVKSVGFYFIDISQNILGLANREPMMVWFGLGAIIVFAILAMVIGGFIHHLLFDFHFFSFGKMGVSKIAIELFIGLILLSIALLLITGIKAILVFWLAFLIYYIFAISLLKIIDIIRLVRLEKWG